MSSDSRTTLTIAATDPRVLISQTSLDRNRGELNTPAGTVNLHTGRLEPANPAHLHTRSTTVAPAKQPTPQWDSYLMDTFAGHPGIAGYVQQLAGYSATGYIRDHILPFLYGAGKNGKSVLTEVLQKLLGDYAEPAPANFLMDTGQQHPTEIARLQGARLVIASEVPEGGRFDEDKVKRLTGGDTLTARYMHGDFFNFEPTHKLWLHGNHQPRVSAGGYSFWRRLRQIPFTNTVPDNKQNPDLANQLVEEEGPGILAWIVEGAVTFLQNGLDEPAEVLTATQEYEASEDHLGRFFEDRVIVGGGDLVRVGKNAMRSAYVNWCRAEGQNPLSANLFTREVKTRFQVAVRKSNGVWQYTNATLTGDDDDLDGGARRGVFDDLGGGSRW